MTNLDKWPDRMQIGAMLYSIINEIGKEKIQSDVTSDIGVSKHYIEMIMDEMQRANGACRINKFSGSLCEGLLVFYVDGVYFAFLQEKFKSMIQI